MADQQQCHLDHLMQLSRPWTPDEMLIVEGHVSSGNCQICAHHSFKVLKRDKDSGLNTPLFLLGACMNGYFKSVQRMIEVWRVDVEATANLSLHPMYASQIGPETDGLHGVTPLFVAALKNDIKLVRYLVGKGANVSTRTSTDNKGPFSGITPLHAALLNLEHGSESKEARSLNQTDVIRFLLENGADPSALSSDGTPTWMFAWIRSYQQPNNLIYYYLPDVSAISLLLEYGMNIDQRCPKLGRTLLHQMAGLAHQDGKEIVKLLLEKGADFQVPDKEGITPILSAAIGNYRRTSILILTIFVDRDDISNLDKIEALEVAAAVLLSALFMPDESDEIEYCLSRAQELREIEGIALISKTPSNERAVEWATSSELVNIKQRRSEFGMQSILIRLRILSTKSWGAIYRYLWPSIEIKYFCKLDTSSPIHFYDSDDSDDGSYHGDYISHQELAELLDISWIMLETIRRFAPASDVEEISLVTDTVVDTLAGTLSRLKKKKDPLFNAETLKISFELLSTALQAQFICEKDNLPSNTMKSLGKMFSFLVDLPDVMIQPICDYLKEIVSLNNQASYQRKLIIFACVKKKIYNHEDNPDILDSENSQAFVRFLLHFGSDADVVDGYSGDGPLHILAAEPNGLWTNAIAQLLLDSGAHLDRTNKYGITAADVWEQKRQQQRKRRRGEGHPAGRCQDDLPDWLREDVPRLMCLTARVIRSHRIPYKKVLPSSLKTFVSFH